MMQVIREERRFMERICVILSIMESSIIILHRNTEIAHNHIFHTKLSRIDGEVIILFIVEVLLVGEHDIYFESKTNGWVLKFCVEILNLDLY